MRTLKSSSDSPSTPKLSPRNAPEKQATQIVDRLVEAIRVNDVASISEYQSHATAIIVKDEQTGTSPGLLRKADTTADVGPRLHPLLVRKVQAAISASKPWLENWEAPTNDVDKLRSLLKWAQEALEDGRKDHLDQYRKSLDALVPALRSDDDPLIMALVRRADEFLS